MSFLVTVAVLWGIAAATPGPNFIAVTRCALTGGRQIGSACVCGVVSGTIIWGLAGWLGISALFAAAPAAYVAMKLIGGAYICWVGARMLIGALRRTRPLQDAHSTRPMTAMQAYWLGAITNLANPKTAIFVTSLFAAALPQDYHWSQGLASVGVMTGVSATWYMLVAFVFSGRRAGSIYRRTRRVIDGVVGTVFLGFGLKLLTSPR